MSKVAIVTDSTAYIPTDLVSQYGISVVPCVLIWDGETLEDGVDISPTQFYTRLKTSKTLPTTSQVPVPHMYKTFSRLLEEGYDVLGIFLSSKLSGTIQSANQGRDQLGSGKDKVTILDSETTSMSMGFQVLATARAANEGASIADCLKVAEKAHTATSLYFVVDTLEFLHRGGRIGGARRFIGTALNIKPILTIKDGKVEPAGSVRTKTKAMDHIVEVIHEECKGKNPMRLATLHANAEQDSKILLDKASALLNPTETIYSEVSPVVGTHIGPGTVGLAYMTGI